MAPGEAIAIAELVIYIPLIFVPLFIAFRHGWVKPIGWIYLAVFCGIRIASAASEIVSTKHQNSTKDAVSAAILNAVGICPLLLASFALLERVTDWLSPSAIRRYTNYILSFGSIVALILLIAGGVHYGFSSPSPSSLDSGKLLTKIGGIIFLVNYIALILLLFLTMLDLGEVPRGERRMFVASLAALPFLAVRVLYGLMVGFAAGDQVFAFVDGNVYVELGMATIMEVCVVVTYAIAGLKIAPMNQKLEEDEYPSKDEQTFQLKEVSYSSSKSSDESKNVMNDSASRSAQKSRGPI